jgi:hypothetical protein
MLVCGYWKPAFFIWCTAEIESYPRQEEIYWKRNDQQRVRFQYNRLLLRPRHLGNSRRPEENPSTTKTDNRGLPIVQYTFFILLTLFSISISLFFELRCYSLSMKFSRTRFPSKSVAFCLNALWLLSSNDWARCF